jgi:glutamine amidotransferase
MIERAAPFEKVSLQDEDWQVELSEEKRPDQRGFVIASRPLTDERWKELAPGSLSVFKEGQCVYGAY